MICWLCGCVHLSAATSDPILGVIPMQSCIFTFMLLAYWHGHHTQLSRLPVVVLHIATTDFTVDLNIQFPVIPETCGYCGYMGYMTGEHFCSAREWPFHPVPYCKWAQTQPAVITIKTGSDCLFSHVDEDPSTVQKSRQHSLLFISGAIFDPLLWNIPPNGILNWSPL